MVSLERILSRGLHTSGNTPSPGVQTPTDTNIPNDGPDHDLRNLEPNAKSIHQTHILINNEDQKLDEMMLVLFDRNYKQQRNEMLSRGLTYDEAYLCWKLKKNNMVEKFPMGFWRSKETARNFFYAGLDSLDGFKTAREDTDIKTMRDIYKKEVLNYTAISHKTNGQTAFYYEVLGLRSFMTGKISYLKKKGSSAEVIRHFLPQLIDIRNPDALNPLDVEHQYWNDPENAKYHILLALDTIDGFLTARETNNIKKMAELYRDNVINFENTTKIVVSYSGQTAFFYEVGGLQGLITRKRSYLEKEGSAKCLLDLAIPGLVNEEMPGALRLKDVGKDYLNDPDLAKKYVLEGLDLIDGFKFARDKKDIKTMADLYRREVIGYESVNKGKYRWNGQLAFFYEKCNLTSLICNSRDFFERKGSPYAVIKFVLPELVDIRNRDALNPLELQRNMSKWKKVSVSLKILEALDSIPGFLEARLNNDFTEMENLFRKNVLYYEKEGSEKVKREIAFLYEVAKVKEDIEPILEEDNDINPLQFYKSALPDFIGHIIQKAYLTAERNKGLIYRVANQYGVAHEQEALDKGFDGLVNAVLHFDESLGFKLSTFANTFIKNAMIKHLQKKHNDISLDATSSPSNGKGKEKSLSETISYNDEESPYDICTESENKIKLKSVVDLALSELQEREREIIKERFGFGGDEPKTLEEVSRIFKVTRERIRQIETRAKTKLKQYFASTGLDIDSFIED